MKLQLYALKSIVALQTTPLQKKFLMNKTFWCCWFSPQHLDTENIEEMSKATPEVDCLATLNYSRFHSNGIF